MIKKNFIMIANAVVVINQYFKMMVKIAIVIA